MKTYLDFGAGWKAIHTAHLRSQGLEVVAYDFGRNFDCTIHERRALEFQYDVVFASNVLNTHITSNALSLTIAQICMATRLEGMAIVNYPQSPRKMPSLKPWDIEFALENYFNDVQRDKATTCPVWIVRLPKHFAADPFHKCAFTPEEISAANIRPAGAVGANAIVPRLVLEMHNKECVLA